MFHAIMITINWGKEQMRVINEWKTKATELLLGFQYRAFT